MLSGTRLGDDPLLPHSDAEEGLAEGVVDLMRARVVEVLPLKVHVGAFAFGVLVLLREALSEVEGRLTARVVLQETVQLGLEVGVFAVLIVRGLELGESVDERLWDVLAAVGAEAACDSIGWGGGAREGGN